MVVKQPTRKIKRAARGMKNARHIASIAHSTRLLQTLNLRLDKPT